MTENKRFYCKKDGIGQWCVSDRLNQYPMPITSLEFCSVVANVLNGLWSQTQRFEKHNQRLEKENEQLKSEIKVLRDYGIELLEYINSPPPKHRKSILDAVVCFKNKKGDME